MLDNPDGPQRKLIRTIIAGINEYDRAMLNSRMQAGRRIKKSRGGVRRRSASVLLHRFGQGGCR